jgi:hypothetical protein
LFALAAGPVWAQEGSIRGTWSFTAHGGLDLDLAGKVHDAGTGTVLTLPTSVTEKGYSDIYKTPLRWRLEMGYGVADRVELIADLLYSKVSSEEVTVGEVAGLDLKAKFADYEEMGWSLGARYFLTDNEKVKPNVAVWATMSWLEAIPSTFSVPAADVVLEDTPFYDKSIIYGGGVDLGVQYQVARHIYLGASVGLRYQGGPKGLEGLAGTGLEDLNDVGSRFYAPLAVSAVLRF